MRQKASLKGSVYSVLGLGKFKKEVTKGALSAGRLGGAHHPDGQFLPGSEAEGRK